VGLDLTLEFCETASGNQPNKCEACAPNAQEAPHAGSYRLNAYVSCRQLRTASPGVPLTDHARTAACWYRLRLRGKTRSSPPFRMAGGICQHIGYCRKSKSDLSRCSISAATAAGTEAFARPAHQTGSDRGVPDSATPARTDRIPTDRDRRWWSSNPCCRALDAQFSDLPFAEVASNMEDTRCDTAR